MGRLGSGQHEGQGQTNNSARTELHAVTAGSRLAAINCGSSTVHSAKQPFYHAGSCMRASACHAESSFSASSWFSKELAELTARQGSASARCRRNQHTQPHGRTPREQKPSSRRPACAHGWLGGYMCAYMREMRACMCACVRRMRRVVLRRHVYGHVYGHVYRHTNDVHAHMRPALIGCWRRPCDQARMHRCGQHRPCQQA